MKTTIFVAITIAALGAIGATTSIMSSGIPAYAQSFSQSGHTTGPCGEIGGVTCTTSGHTTQTCSFAAGCTFTSSGGFSNPSGSGGGRVTITTSSSGETTCTANGSPSFKATACAGPGGP